METHQLKLSTVPPSMAVGLGILIQKTTTRHNGPVFVTTTNKLPSLHLHSSPKLPSLPAPVSFSGFLCSCHLCRKKLLPDRDIYMYRGDLGFCSIRCRERQMVVDDMKKLEDSRKKMAASPRHCGISDGEPREIRLLREELRQRRRLQVLTQKTR